MSAASAREPGVPTGTGACRPFRPNCLRPSASLNRRRFLIPQAVDPELAAKTAHAVLSRHALGEAVARKADELGIGADAGRTAYPQSLNSALNSADDAVRAAAESVASDYGRRLGYLVASMKAGNAVSDDPWEQSYLEHWEHRVTSIVLGGGLANGRMGEVIARSAQASARGLGKAVTVGAAEYPSVLPLIGAGRRLRAGATGDGVGIVGGAMGVVDFGTSGAKSGVALVDEHDALQALYVRPVVELGELTDGEHTAELAAAVIGVIGDVYRAAGQRRPVVPQVVCSVAAYLEEGQPVALAHGAYTQLHRAAGTRDVAGWLSRRVSDEVGARLRVSFVHDGTAAAAAHAGQQRPGSTAVVMLGTALGVGFVPDGAGYRRVAEHFSVASL